MQLARLTLSSALGAVCLMALAIGVSDARPSRTPPPAPVSLPQPGLAPSLVQQAAAYRGYIARATAINPAFTDPATVATALRTGAAYEPQQFLRGALAYAAIAALQDQTFVAAVRAAGGNDIMSRRALEYQLLSDPANVMRLPGATNAAALSSAALNGEGLRLLTSGRAVKRSAYDTQHQAWANTRVTMPAERLAAVRALGSVPLTADVAEASRLNQSAQGRTPLGLLPEPTARAPYSSLVARAVSLAALSTIGMAGEEQLPRIMPNLTDPGATYCLSIAKLNLYQCLAVAGPQYEDMFCLGQHVLLDTSACLIRGSGAALPPEFVPPVAAPPRPSRPYSPRPRRPNR